MREVGRGDRQRAGDRFRPGGVQALAAVLDRREGFGQKGCRFGALLARAGLDNGVDLGGQSLGGRSGLVAGDWAGMALSLL